MVCLLPARNAEIHIDGWLASVERFADQVIALDDGSTDATADRLSAHPMLRVLLRNPVRESFVGWDDGRNRQRLVDAVGDANQDRSDIWTVQLDADERIDADDGDALGAFLRTGADPQRAYLLRSYRMIGDGRQYDRRENWAGRVFAYRPGLALPTAALHFAPLPTDIAPGRYTKTTIRIQHYANATPSLRKARFEKYGEVDPHNRHQPSYGHLLDAPAGLFPWRPRPADLPIELHGPAAALPETEAALGSGKGSVTGARRRIATTPPTIAVIDRPRSTPHSPVALRAAVCALAHDLVIVVDAPFTLPPEALAAVSSAAPATAMGTIAGPGWGTPGHRLQRLLDRSISSGGSPSERFASRPRRCNVFSRRALLLVLESEPDLCGLDEITDALWELGYGATALNEGVLDVDTFAAAATRSSIGSSWQRGARAARHVLAAHEESGALGDVAISVFGARPGWRSVRSLLGIVGSADSTLHRRLRCAATRLLWLPVIGFHVALEQIAGRRIVRAERRAPAHRVRT